MERRNIEKYIPFVEAYKNGEIIYKDGALYRVKKRLNQNKVIDLVKPVIMRMKNPQRYYRVHINGKTCYEHIAIYAIFHGIESLEGFETIDHVDGDRTNNRIENLEGVSMDENNKRAKDMGLNEPHRGASNGMARLTSDVIDDIRKTYATGEYQQREVAKMFGVSQSHVNRIVNNIAWSDVE